MTDNERIAELLFGNIDKTVEYFEEKYPPRALKESARVTRFAPSPTGYLHFGNLFTCLVSYKTAKCSDGVFFVRVEDTDQKRKVDDAIEVMLKGLSVYGIVPDEGVVAEGVEKGGYGPYYQSARKEIYQTYAKSLVQQGLAYPCFLTEAELEDIRASQENESIKGVWGDYAKYRSLTFDEIKEKIDSGEQWTLRLRSPGTPDGKCWFDDMIKGKIEMAENVQDVVLLKSDGIPTYHFAHAIDDHLMRTTHVIRGDEWIASTPIHLQLFRVLGFKPPKYAHVAPVMKEENGGKRKLSKRKDPEMAVTYYDEQGFPQETVIEYMMTLANSNFEDWRKLNAAESVDNFPFNLKKMSVSGALFDMVKLNDISKNLICRMTADTVYNYVVKWAKQYDTELYGLFSANPEKARAILNIDRENPKPRKDIAKWSEVKDYVSYMYNELYRENYALPENIKADDAAAIIESYKKVVNAADDKQVWFDKIKALCEPLGFTPNVKEYKQNPDAFKGHVGDVSTVIRIALTGRTNTPDLHSIIAILGDSEVNSRLERAEKYYKEGK